MNTLKLITRHLLTLLAILAFAGLSACQQGHNTSNNKNALSHEKNDGDAKKHAAVETQKHLKAHIHDHGGDAAANEHAKQHNGDHTKAHLHDHNGDIAAADAHADHH